MGNSSNKPGGTSSNRTLCAFDETIINRGTISSPRALLKFHSVHGSNITLSDDRLLAKRRPNVFCKGLVFSDRPIEIDEIVCIRLTEVCSSWSGVLRFGVTNVDPASFRDIELPKFACPDLTAKTGYWAKALAERYSIQGSILHFYISSSGILYIGCNGYSRGSYLHEIDVTKPLWIMMDIYGKSVAVEFLSEINERTRAIATAIEDRRHPTISLNEASAAATVSSPLSPFATAPPPVSPITVSTPRPEGVPYRFHIMAGVNTLRVSDWEVARKDNEFDRGYCFLERPIRIDEVVSIKIIETETAFHGSMAFGLTNCNPRTLRPTQLPADCDDLLERPEYWTVIKDVAAVPDRGDILSFCLKDDGRLLFAKNRGFPRPIMYMDTSVELWPFFDVFGRTKRIQLTKPQRLNTLSENSSDSRESSSEPPARPPPPRLPSSFISASRDSNDHSFFPTFTGPSSHDDRLSPLLYPLFSTQTRESNSLASMFNLNNDSSSSSNLTSLLHSDTAPPQYTLQQPNHPSPARESPRTQTRESLDAGQASLDNAENIILRNLASLYVSPRTATSAPQLPIPSIPPRNASSMLSNASPAIPAPASTSVAPKNFNQREKSPSIGPPNSSECVICFSASINAAVYRCGHVCMCLSCARQLMSNLGNCPMCRQSIQDVVQLFFS